VTCIFYAEHRDRIVVFRRENMSLLQKIFGTHSEREIKIVKPLLEKINKLED